MGPSLAVIELAFDPIARIGDLAVRWETAGVALAILVALLAAAFGAGRTPIDVDADARAGILGPEAGDRVRRDDLLFVVLGAVPGAVLGGRVGYVALYPDYFMAHPAAILDPATGGLELVGAVLGGAATAAVVGALLEAPLSRWFHLAAIPLLLALGLGKAAQALGGSGQGELANVPWATAYLGPGPWGSLAPDLPAHPAQLYEAAATGLVLLVVLALATAGAFDRRDGRAFAVAVCLWALGRAAVATVWRDPIVLGPLRGEQLLALAAAVIAALAAIVTPRLARRPVRKYLEEEPPPAWPDPATRPRF